MPSPVATECYCLSGDGHCNHLFRQFRVLCQLHWLPLLHCIKFKVELYLVHQALCEHALVTVASSLMATQENCVRQSDVQ